MRKQIKHPKCAGMWMRHKWTVGRMCKRERCDAIRNKATGSLGVIEVEIPEIPPESPLETPQGGFLSRLRKWL